MEIKRLAMVACLAACSNSALAQNSWYAGVELGTIDHQYSPEYSFANGSESTSFKNNSDGMEVGLLAGYSLPVAERFSMAIQARIGRNDSEWTLALPSEPANFSYKIATSAALSVVPAVQVHERVSVFGEIGYASGHVKEWKSSPASDRSSYDFSEWVDGWVWGLGAALRLNNQWSLHAVYRKADYSELDYKTYLPNGTHHETVSDSPVTEAFSLGATYEF